MWCDVMWCVVMWCDVMWCDVMWCDVMWSDMMWRDLKWRQIPATPRLSLRGEIVCAAGFGSTMKNISVLIEFWKRKTDFSWQMLRMRQKRNNKFSIKLCFFLFKLIFIDSSEKFFAWTQTVFFWSLFCIVMVSIRNFNSCLDLNLWLSALMTVASKHFYVVSSAILPFFVA